MAIPLQFMDTLTRDDFEHIDDDVPSASDLRQAETDRPTRRDEDEYLSLLAGER